MRRAPLVRPLSGGLSDAGPGWLRAGRARLAAAVAAAGAGSGIGDRAQVPSGARAGRAWRGGVPAGGGLLPAQLDGALALPALELPPDLVPAQPQRPRGL